MRRHPFDPFSFLFGALFATIGATFLFGDSGALAVRPWRAWPAAVIVVGLAVVLWAVIRVLRPQPDAATGAAPDAAGPDASANDATPPDAAGPDAAAPDASQDDSDDGPSLEDEVMSP